MIQNIKGTKDLLPESTKNWQFVEDIFKKCSELYGYEEIRTPIFEKTEVFSRSIGENTDIVNKEMYTFEDKGGDSLTLRPEQTAALVRSVIQHTLARNISDLRLWYFGPFFRYEQPQKGRQRQFHQYGAECISSPNPEADVEIILLANSIIRNLGIENHTILLNTLGTNNSRNIFKDKLVDFLKSIRTDLSEESQRRVETNPLRVLDSKDKKDIEILKEAPSLLESLDEESKLHFDRVRDLLEKNGIAYQIDNKLVRGLDYYNHTVFEFQSNALGSQNAFGGGGRYDGLFAQLGGKPVPAVGFAMGVERLILILEESKKLEKIYYSVDAYIVNLNPDKFEFSLQLSETLRAKGLKISQDLQHRSLKAQMKEANKVNAKYSIMVGDEEINTGNMTIKHMKTGEQSHVRLDQLANILLNSNM